MPVPDKVPNLTVPAVAVRVGVDEGVTVTVSASVSVRVIEAVPLVIWAGDEYYCENERQG